MRRNVYLRLFAEALHHKKALVEEAQERHEERVRKRLEQEMMFIRAAAAEYDRKKLEEELKQIAFQKIEWDETLDYLRSIEQSREFDR